MKKFNSYMNHDILNCSFLANSACPTSKRLSVIQAERYFILKLFLKKKENWIKAYNNSLPNDFK